MLCARKTTFFSVLFCWTALLSYIFVVSCSSDVENHSEISVLEAFDTRIWRKAEDFAQRDDLFDLGVQYQTFALFRTLYQKPEQYKPLIDEIKIIFSDKFVVSNSAEDASMEMDYFTAIIISELVESNPDLIIGALNDALGSNHPLNIYAETPKFNLDEILEDPINLEPFGRWMQRTLLAELATIKKLFKKDKMTTESSIEVLVLIHQYSRCTVHLGPETDLQINKMFQLVLEFPDLAFESIQKAFEFGFMNFGQFYGFVGRFVRRIHPEALKAIEIKFSKAKAYRDPQIDGIEAIEATEHFKSFSLLMKAASEDNSGRQDLQFIRQGLTKSLRFRVAFYSMMALKLFTSQTNFESLVCSGNRFLGLVFEYFEFSWFKYFVPKIPTTSPFALLNIKNETRIEPRSYEKLRNLLTISVNHGFFKMAESISRVLPEDSMTPADRFGLIDTASQLKYPRIALALYKNFSPHLEADDHICVLNLAALDGNLELAKEVLPKVKEEANLLLEKTATKMAIDAQNWATAEFLLLSLESSSDLPVRKVSEFCVEALKSGFSEVKVMKIVTKFAGRFNLNHLKLIYLAGIEIFSWDVVLNDAFKQANFIPDHSALEVAFKHGHDALIDHLAEIVSGAADHVDKYAQVILETLCVRNLFYIIKTFGFTPDEAFIRKWIARSIQVAIEKNSFFHLLELKNLGREIDFETKIQYSKIAEEKGASEIANYLRT